MYMLVPPVLIHNVAPICTNRSVVPPAVILPEHLLPALVRLMSSPAVIVPETWNDVACLRSAFALLPICSAVSDPNDPPDEVAVAVWAAEVGTGGADEAVDAAVAEAVGLEAGEQAVMSNGVTMNSGAATAAGVAFVIRRIEFS
jgi:hypothetical protein